MSKALRILLVEDSEDDLHLIVRELTRDGYAPTYRQVYTETGLRAALREGRWDVVVCDYLLPGFQAEDALKAVQEADPDMPFIVVSGRMGEETAVAMMRAGAHDYLMKHNLRRLVPAIERELREAEVRRRRRRAEEELRAANAAKDRFLATLSHELRNPLAAISASIDAMCLQAAGNPALQRALAVLKRNVEIQARLVNDLLDLSRISLGKLTVERQPMRLDTVLRAAVAEYRGAAERAGLSLLTARLRPVWTDGDADRLRQVFGNLLDNAIKFTPPGGQITLTMERQEGWIRVSVGDTGIGLEASQLDSVFDLFRQGPAAGERRAYSRGLGVGLALVKQLVELHGGRVWAESPGPGRGSRFTVELAECPAPVQEQTAGAGRPAAALAGLRVLMIDDNLDLLMVIQQVLELEGCAVTAVATGEQALAYLEDHEPPDIILCDLSLPGMDGVEFLQRARQLPGLEQVPALALSGFGEPADVRWSQGSGFSAHLIKPVALDDLRAHILRALGIPEGAGREPAVRTERGTAVPANANGSSSIENGISAATGDVAAAGGDRSAATNGFGYVAGGSHAEDNGAAEREDAAAVYRGRQRAV